jgi:hypothetical protein
LGALWQCRNEKLEGGDLAAQGGEGSGGGVVGGRGRGGEDRWEGSREGERIVWLAGRVGGLRRILGTECVEHVGHGAVESVNCLSEGDEAGEGDALSAMEAKFGDDGSHVCSPVEGLAEVRVDEWEGADRSEALDEVLVRAAKVEAKDGLWWKGGEMGEGSDKE